MSQQTPTLRHWIMWILGASFFFLIYLPRVSISGMATELMEVFQVNATQLGMLGSCFLYPYVAMQVPVGLLVDRFGTRRLLSAMALLTGLACLLFAYSHNLLSAQVSRLLMGFSASFAFVGALKIASTWFPASRFGLLAGMTQALGMVGGYVGASPVAASIEHVGWRNTMILIAIAFVLLATLLFSFVRDRPRKKSVDAQQTEHLSIRASLWQVVINPQSWMVAFYVGMVYAPVTVFAELWGISYLETTHNLTHQTAAFATGMIFVGWGIGGPLMGWLSDYLQLRKPILILSALSGFVLMSLILYGSSLSTGYLYTLMLLFGVSNTGVGVGYAMAAEISPRPIAGTSLAFANMASVIFGAILQPIVGKILDLHANTELADNLPLYSATAYKNALLLLPVFLLLGAFVSYFIKETHCRSVEPPVEPL